MEFKVLIATKGDAQNIAKLERECFTTPWTAQNILDSIESSTLFLKATEGKGLIGYCGMQLTLKEGYITNVAVTKGCRGNGVGTALLESLLAIAQEKGLNLVSLEVRVSNKTAISLYKKLGFLALGERKDFYREPRENALIMTKFFKD